MVRCVQGGGGNIDKQAFGEKFNAQKSGKHHFGRESEGKMAFRLTYRTLMYLLNITHDHDNTRNHQ